MIGMLCRFHKIVKFIIFTTAFFFAGSTDLKSQYYQQMLFIDSLDSYEEIIQKSAWVVPDERQLKWQQLELTAFIHFGMNTFTDREWGDGSESPGTFNPTQIDVSQWITTLKKSGFRQVIFTAKHHDGFCLWPTSTTKHSVKYTPWANGEGDVVRQVADACWKHNIGFGIYLSPWDRNAPTYGSDAYNDLFVAQLSELLTRYGEIAEVWLDGANGADANGKKQNYDFARWFKVIRQLQPEATIAIMGPDIRWVGTETGAGRETEWSVIPAYGRPLAEEMQKYQNLKIFSPLGDLTAASMWENTEMLEKATALIWYPAETDVSIRPGWFFHSTENERVKTGAEIFNIYMTSVGRNGTLLLNVPPGPEGKIHVNDSISLADFKLLYDHTFYRNYVDKIFYRGDNITESCTDRAIHTDFHLTDNDTAAVYIYTSEDEAIDLLMVQENIAKGQRIAGFTLECKNVSGQWEQVCKGTTIGYKRLLSFEKRKSKIWRFKILSSRDVPNIAEIGLYRIGKKESNQRR